MIVGIYLAHNEVAVHGNPDAAPDARIAAFAGLRPVLGEDRLTVGPARFHRVAVAEPGRSSVGFHGQPAGRPGVGRVDVAPSEPSPAPGSTAVLLQLTGEGFAGRRESPNSTHDQQVSYAEPARSHRVPPHLSVTINLLHAR
jgi:hypothetical protein